MLRVSVIVPALNEAKNIARTLACVRQAGECELIVVDGGSDDGTLQVAAEYADQILIASRGRATQMNAGARAAGGDVLLFLHADTVLPAQFPLLIEQALTDSRYLSGRFDVCLDASGWPFRMIETFMNLRSRITRISTGDQAIFVRRNVFFALGAYPEVALMEDLGLSRVLKRVGKVVCLRARVTTSARRWQRQGVARTIVLMWVLRLCFFLGVAPRYLKIFYMDARSSQ